MKSLTALLTVLFLAANALVAQQNSFFIGTNAGINFSKFKYTEDLAELYSNSIPITGLNGGVSAGLIIQNVSFTAGLQYIQKGGHYETDNFIDQQGTGFLAADEKLQYLAIPLQLGYRAKIFDNFGVSLSMGPSINLGLSGKIDESKEYYGSDDISTERYSVQFGSSVNDDYRKPQVSFLFSPGLFFELNDKSQITFNLTWDNGLNDSYNQRYKQANTFFDDYKGNQFNRSTVLTIGYEYHFSFQDRY